MPPSEKLIYVCLCQYANPEKGESCQMGAQQLADDSGYHRRTVVRALKAIEESGMIRKQRNPIGTANIYTMIPSDHWPLSVSFSPPDQWSAYSQDEHSQQNGM